MALQMATNITPDVFSGVGGETFDADVGLDVSWQVNGTSPMTAYRIVIQSYNESSTQLYTTGKVALATPFYGTNYKGNVQFFQANTISASALAGAGITNGNSYKMVITQWWGATDAQSVTQNSAAIIAAWSRPTLTLDELPNPITSRIYTFAATFNQSQGDTINWIRWQVAPADDTDNVIYDSGNIYGTSELRLDYDGLFTGVSYAVQCSVQTQSGMEVSTGWVAFNVSYTVSQPDGVLTAQMICQKKGINVNWSSARSTVGYVNGNYEIKDDALTLSNGSQAVWETENDKPINYGTPYSFIWKGRLPVSGIHAFEFEQEGYSTPFSVVLNFGEGVNTAFQLIGLDFGEDYNPIATATQKVRADRWWVVCGTPDKIVAQAFEYTGGLYPDTNLYPSQTLYPIQNTGILPMVQMEITSSSKAWKQHPLTKVTLNGPQTTEYLWITEGVLSDETIATALSDGTYHPAWTANTMYLATFTDGLNAGNLETNGYALYRRNIATGEYLHLLDMGIDITSVFDFGARNQNEYEYQLYYADDTSFTASPMSSQPITPCIWEWVLCACTEDENGIYHVQRVYSFGCNVESGTVSNNNSPTLQKTFTKYPNYQPDTANYRSGTLKGLIGKVDPVTNQYSDTVELAQELNDLSTSNWTIFLKDRKGNMYMVRTGSAIQATITDVYPNQATSIAIPWVEIGDASDAVVLAVPGDDVYEEMELATASVRRN